MISNKLLHFQEFVFATSFEALWIMKDEFVVAPENQLILDVVQSALKKVNLNLHDV